MSAVERQLAVERVRAEVASMRSSDDLVRVVALMLQQIKHLGVQTPAASILFINEETDQMVDYTALATEFLPKELWSHLIAVSDDIAVSVKSSRYSEADENRVREWRDQKPGTSSQEITPEAIAESYRASGIDFAPDKDNPWLGEWFITRIPFPYGVVSFRERTYRKEIAAIAQEFTEALSLGYLRFLDFQKVEDQNRELTIQNALERVRSRASAMQESDELSGVTSVLFEQFRGLGHDLYIAAILVQDEASGVTEWWTESEIWGRTHSRAPIANVAPGDATEPVRSIRDLP